MRLALGSFGLALVLGACGRGPTGTPPWTPSSPSTRDGHSAEPTPTPARALPNLCPASEDRATRAKGVLPDVTLHCLGSAETVQLRRLTGRPILVNFWASWCGPCKVELPLLARAQEASDGAVSFVGVDVQDSAEEAWKLLTELGVKYPQLEDPRGVTRGPFGWSGGLPLTVFVDGQGRMVGTERSPFRSFSEVRAAIDHHLGVSVRDVKP